MCDCETGGEDTCLGAGHQVSLGLDDGDGVLLHGGGAGVAAQGNVAHDDLPHVHIMELQAMEKSKSCGHSVHVTNICASSKTCPHPVKCPSEMSFPNR